MEGAAGSGIRGSSSAPPLATMARSEEGIEKRPDGVKPFGRVGATGYYNFRSFD